MTHRKSLRGRNCPSVSGRCPSKGRMADQGKRQENEEATEALLSWVSVSANLLERKVDVLANSHNHYLRHPHGHCRSENYASLPNSGAGFCPNERTKFRLDRLRTLCDTANNLHEYRSLPGLFHPGLGARRKAQVFAAVFLQHNIASDSRPLSGARQLLLHCANGNDRRACFHEAVRLRNPGSNQRDGFRRFH